MPDPLYFDNNATTFLDPAVADRMAKLACTPIANASSQHQSGRRALRILEQARSTILHAIDAPAEGIESARVIFTSGGTEANNLIVFGRAFAPNNSSAADKSNLVIVSAIEHPSVLEAASQLPSFPVLPVDQAGRVCLETLKNWLELDQHRIGLVSIMMGNNETGILQDVESIAILCHRYGIPVHCDLVQVAGKIPFSMRSSNIDAVTLSAHKLHGPVGIGALVVRTGLVLAPRLFGGGQQLELRPGTEPVLLADAMATALQCTLTARQEGAYQKLAVLRDHFESSLLADLPDIEVIGQSSPRLPHTSNMAFHGLDRQAVFMALDLAGIACSTGSACASGSGRPSHVLTAMQLAPSTIQSAIRFSFSRYTTPKEVDSGVERIVSVIRKLRNMR